MNHTETLWVQNIGSCLSCHAELPKRGPDLSDPGLIRGIDMVIRDGIIRYMGPNGHQYLDEIKQTGAPSGDHPEHGADPGLTVYDAGGRTVIPGLIDAHTHLVFAGERANEFYWRASGKSYQAIQQEGGGIRRTMTETRRASPEELIEQALFFLGQAFRAGTTTMEVKSGYGLDYDNELKILQVIEKLNQLQPVELIPTFLGAHIHPPDCSASDYMDQLLNRMLPDFRRYCQRCDIFLDRGAFSRRETELYFVKALSLEYRLMAHLNQLEDLGGIALIHHFPIDSMDHLEILSDRDAEILAESETVGIFLPIAEMVLHHPDPGAYRKLRDAGGLVSLATDFNPGSAPCFSIPILMHLAALRYGIGFAEILNSVTLQAAFALREHDRIGSLHPGKQADLIILDLKNPEVLPYFPGTDFIRAVIKNGRLYPSEHRPHSDHRANPFF
ncbi:MAG: imidazolonepropionase [Candidatus Delongbacteria bacterium]|nr:imidazolonepropionase [Candidatus Delongbacteria bacterium]